MPGPCRSATIRMASMPSWTKKSSGPSCVITRAPGYARIHGTERARRRDRDLLGPKDQHPTHDYLLLVRREPISRVFGFFLTRISMPASGVPECCADRMLLQRRLGRAS
jgi:hypothetical protein